VFSQLLFLVATDSATLFPSSFPVDRAPADIKDWVEVEGTICRNDEPVHLWIVGIVSSYEHSGNVLVSVKPYERSVVDRAGDLLRRINDAHPALQDSANRTSTQQNPAGQDPAKQVPAKRLLTKQAPTRRDSMQQDLAKQGSPKKAPARRDSAKRTSVQQTPPKTDPALPDSNSNDAIKVAGSMPLIFQKLETVGDNAIRLVGIKDTEIENENLVLVEALLSRTETNDRIAFKLARILRLAMADPTSTTATDPTSSKQPEGTPSKPGDTSSKPEGPS